MARNRNEIEEMAHNVGLTVGTYHPGDGVTRYRFFKETANASDGDYFGGSHPIDTVFGRKAAVEFLTAFKAGRAHGLTEAIGEINRLITADNSPEQILLAMRRLLSEGPWHFGEAVTTCRFCGEMLHLDRDSWVDATDGDCCSGNRITGENENQIHAAAL